jgi:hypothetical protein
MKVNGLNARDAREQGETDAAAVGGDADESNQAAVRRTVRIGVSVGAPGRAVDYGAHRSADDAAGERRRQ